MQLNESQARAVEKFLAESGDSYEYNDNHRYATEGNAEQWYEYQKLYDQGCCGSVDVILECDDGTRLLYGFNYGRLAPIRYN